MNYSESFVGFFIPLLIVTDNYRFGFNRLSFFYVDGGHTSPSLQHGLK